MKRIVCFCFHLEHSMIHLRVGVFRQKRKCRLSVQLNLKCCPSLRSGMWHTRTKTNHQEMRASPSACSNGVSIFCVLLCCLGLIKHTVNIFYTTHHTPCHTHACMADGYALPSPRRVCASRALAHGHTLRLRKTLPWL